MRNRTLILTAACFVVSVASFQKRCDAQQHLEFTIVAQEDPIPFTDYNAYWFGKGQIDGERGRLRVQMSVNWFNKTTDPMTGVISLTNVHLVVRHGNNGKPILSHDDLSGTVAAGAIELYSGESLVMKGIVVKRYVGDSPREDIPSPIVGPGTITGYIVIP